MTIAGRYVIFFGFDWPSNFAESPITVPDDFWEKGIWDEPYFPPTVTFKTAEAYYQSRKAVMANDKYNYYRIALASTPSLTKKIAREIKLDSAAWNRVREKYMMETLRLKFTQNPDLMSKLMSPEMDGKMFVEASPWDTFWGAGRDEKTLVKEIQKTGCVSLHDGKYHAVVATNMLGNLLMKFRIEQKRAIKKAKKEG